MQMREPIIDAVEDFSRVFHHLRFYRFPEVACFIDYIIKCLAIQDQLFCLRGYCSRDNTSISFMHMCKNNSVIMSS